MGFMGSGNRPKKSSSSSVFNIFKAKKSSAMKVEDARDDSRKVNKVWPSDEDRCHWVAEPGIDRKATAYIDKIRAATQRVSET